MNDTNQTQPGEVKPDLGERFESVIQRVLRGYRFILDGLSGSIPQL